MRKFILAISLFLGLNVLLGVLYLFLTQTSYSYHMGNTTSILFTIPKREAFDVVLLGTSHAQNFSSSELIHARVENLLQKKMGNLSKQNAGFDEEKLFLTHFYAEGNTTRTVLYFLDPFVFYSRGWDTENHFLNDEPLYPDFFWEAVRQGTNRNVLIDYVRSKFIGWWLFSRRPVEATSEGKALTDVDPEAVKKRLAYLYPDGLDTASFQHYEQSLREIVKLVNSHGGRIIFVYPPSLLGVQPGSEGVKASIQRLREDYLRIDFFDMSASILDPRLYGDHDHLNVEGIMLFINRYVKPIVNND